MLFVVRAFVLQHSMGAIMRETNMMHQTVAQILRDLYMLIKEDLTENDLLLGNVLYILLSSRCADGSYDE